MNEATSWAEKDITAGIIGTDTSHVRDFTNTLHEREEWRVRVTAAFPAGSPDIGSSRKRVEQFSTELRDSHDVELVESVEALLDRVDAVMILSVDGRPHMEQARAAFDAKKRVFIDKPFTAGLGDAREILRLSSNTGVPFFSSSCVRFQQEVAGLRENAAVGTILKAQGSSPLRIEPHHPDLFWYGIHGVEALYTILGRGCVSASRRIEGTLDVTTGTWANDRIGIFQGVREGDYLPLAKVWGTEGEAESTGGYDYHGLIETIAEFFHTGKAPIDPLETLEIIEFMTAAQLSTERGGDEVALDELRAS